MLIQFIKFIGVGVIATAMQYAILILGVEWLSFNPVLASTLGYLLSAILNYILNYYFTFTSQEKHRIAVIKFSIVVCAGLILNASAMHFFYGVMEIQYLFAQVLATALVFVWNFSANRKWTYKAD
ncbi:GtrA family protein [Marinobacterium rhizophilum]|uniref:GtrA family protein n=1 Tax=Marinobacterium rhizophilum TaxID=420402 RepID=UPI000372FA5F|nr:GtrA family protein [Marinobacterium rhizophilum]